MASISSDFTVNSNFGTAPSFSYGVGSSAIFRQSESTYIVSLRWLKEAVCGGGVTDLIRGISGVLYRADRLYTDRIETDMLDISEEDSSLDSGAIHYERDFCDETGEISLILHAARPSVINGAEEFCSMEGDIALISESVFFTALKWHHDTVEVESTFPGDGSLIYLFSLETSIFYESEKGHLVIKIFQEGNDDEFREARRILFAEPSMLQVWDLSGKIEECFQSTDMDVPLQIFGLSFPLDGNENLMVEEYAEAGVDNKKLLPEVSPSSEVGDNFYHDTSLGFTGLYNLGNTCYMNSVLQCLMHTPKFLDYFLGDFRKDLNNKYGLTTNCSLATTFGGLLRNFWAPGASVVCPSTFKSTISSFAPEFEGHNHHDSLEFLLFLLVGLHEDLNSVKRKPYIQGHDGDGRLKEVVGDECWKTNFSCNESIITDLFQGQFRLKLVCPICKNFSVTFDPFLYLSLPLSSPTKLKITVTVIGTDGTTLPHPYGVHVPECGTLEDLIRELGVACSLKDNEVLLLAQIFNNSTFRFLENPLGSIKIIRYFDFIVAYRLQKDMEEFRRVVFLHQLDNKICGVPFVTTMSDCSKKSEILEAFLNLIRPFLHQDDESVNDDVSMKSADDVEMKDSGSESNEMDSVSSRFKITVNESGSSSTPLKPIEVMIHWSRELIQQYDMSLLRRLPAVCNPGLPVKLKSNSGSLPLYTCIEGFLKEDRFRRTSMWYCPGCKEHRRPDKKSVLWSLPEFLIIHLRRFCYSRRVNSKVSTRVDFPIMDLDLSDYIALKDCELRHRYRLYGVINHHGDSVAGHYTAFVKGKMGWYEFDDEKIGSVDEDKIVTAAAYVLFYKRNCE